MPLVDEIPGNLIGVEDNNALAQCIQIYDIPCKRRQLAKKATQSKSTLLTKFVLPFQELDPRSIGWDFPRGRTLAEE